MSEVAEKLRAARELIARPGGWTQKASARNERGAPVLSRSSKATCWCGVGATERVAIASASMQKTMRSLLNRAVGGSFIHWNDASGRTQAEVVEAFTRAIALAEAESA